MARVTIRKYLEDKQILRIRSIDYAALLIALLVTLVVIVSGGIVVYAYGFFLWGLAVICAATFVVTYLFSRFVLKKFVIYKMKPIYQIVFDRNLRTRDMENVYLKKENLLETVTAEITDWAESNRQEIERLEEMEQFRREYLGNFAHEIKTPVFNIQGYLSTLLDGALHDESVNRLYLDRAEKSIGRIVDIITYLEEISHLESGQPHFEYTRFDVVELAREIVDAFEMEAHSRGIRVKLRAAAGKKSQESLFVVADRKYIAQVFANLISNSIRYGTAGGWTHISLIDMFDKVMVEVADNGEGIEKEDVARLFERFFRTDASRSREKGGTGLGLAIVKHIIEAHGETVSVRSELGVGTTFSFTLSKI
ncbi:MAG: sensor histidine kinase [Alistipes sp.]|jgi:two-component system phosphate regulon sensor histidine kinase PhoR|nr:sensor histidine kinase [Alistipes sp.]